MRNPSSFAHNYFSSSKQKSKTPCCRKVGIKKGPWTPEEDDILATYIKRHGEGHWRTLPEHAGLLRCGKSCRLRWMNYLRPSIKRGPIAPDEEDLILRLHRLLGNRWSLIAGRIPGRTDNEIKNYWNTHLSKKLINQGIDPRTHKPFDANPNSNPSCSKVTHNCSATLTVFPNINPNPNPNYSQLTTPAEENISANLSAEGLIMEKSDHDHQRKEEDHNEDATFSSFFDSIIDSDNNYEFVNYQGQVGISNHLVQDIDALWEADELTYAMETLDRAEENMAVIFDNHSLI